MYCAVQKKKCASSCGAVATSHTVFLLNRVHAEDTKDE